MSRVSVLCGPSRSTRVQRIDDMVRGQWGRSLLIVPTAQQVQRRREQLLLEGGLTGGSGESVTTFRRFALDLLQSAHIPVSELSEVERRLLLEQVVARMRRERDDPPPALASRGFVRHLQHIITLLKQAAIDPAFFRERVFVRRQPSWLDAIVAEAYEAYQDAIQARQAYDVVGLYWQAALACAREVPPLLRDVTLIALDGFDDFTPSEFRLLRALAPHVDTLVFGIACNRLQPSQSDVYRIPIKTASLLQQAFAADQQDLEEAPAATHAEFAASEIFPRDVPEIPDGLTPNVELLPCATAGIEAEVVARRVKGLILEGQVSPCRIAVVHRDLQAAGPRFLAALAEAGVPVQVDRKQRLSESAFGHFLLQLVDCWDGWERAALEEVLASPFFVPYPEFDAHRDAVRTVLRLACGTRGYKAVHSGLTAFTERLKRTESMDRMGGLRSHPQPVEAVQAVLHAVELLHEMGQILRRATTSAAFAHAVQGLCEQLAPENQIASLPSESLRAAEASACAALRETLARYVSWHDSAGDGEKRPWSELTAELRQVLSEASFTPPSAKNGVRVLEAEAVRHVDVDVVFLTGMNAGVFPRPARANAIYSEADLRDLQACHIPLETKQKQVDRELLLYQQVLSSARRRLLISWAYESGSGRELLRSPFVGDLEDLFGKGTLAESAEGRRAVAEPQEVASWRDLCATAASDTSRPAVIHGQLSGMFERIELERTRQGFAPFGVYDGVFSDDALVDQLRERFGSDHVYSADQLETYAECPFAFFAQRVLDVQEIEAAGPEIDARMRGSIFHDVLQHFYEGYRGRLPVSIELDEAQTRLAVLLDAAFERLRRNGISSEGLLAAEKARASKILRRHLRLHLHDGDWIPSHFEVSFGRVKERSEDPCNRPDPVALRTESGMIRLAGKIDRIDTHDGRVRIIDYKSSVRVNHSDIEDGVSLQLLLYALAVEEHLLPGQECAQAVLLGIGSKKSQECLNRDGKAGGKRLDWHAREQVLRQKVGEYVAGIQAGHFPPRPYVRELCTFCAMSRVCRYEQARVERKEGAVHAVD